MIALRHRHAVREVSEGRGLADALALRAACFRGGGDDRDAFDETCRHVVVEDADGPACTFRTMVLPPGGIGAGYAARHYDLDALGGYGAPALELGRFCIRPGARGADVLRLAWGALARRVEAEGAGMLVGCSSFRGTDPGAHAEAFAMLAARHLAPARWAPGRRAPETHRLPARPHDARAALAGMPPLLRSYLGMGGWVSDHAVVDRDLGTLHVFTGLEVARIPSPRLRALRALAAA